MYNQRVLRTPFMNGSIKKLITLLFVISFQIVFSQTQSENSKITNTLLEFEYTIYPNPSKNNVNIKTNSIYDDLSIQIMNYSGQVVKTLSRKKTNLVEIDISKLSNGTYYMIIKSRKQKLAIREFIVSK